MNRILALLLWPLVVVFAVACVGAVSLKRAPGLIVGQLDGSAGDTVDLYTEAGPYCTGAAKRALYVPKPGSGDPNVEGCWKVVGAYITVMFLDGDFVARPASDLKTRSGV